jgi:hypothetical protein
MAENGGFEPPIELSPYNGLANRRLQPLGQLSVCVAVSICLSAMPGCGNYSLRPGWEDKVLEDDMGIFPGEAAKRQRQIPAG